MCPDHCPPSSVHLGSLCAALQWGHCVCSQVRTATLAVIFSHMYDDFICEVQCNGIIQENVACMIYMQFAFHLNFIFLLHRIHLKFL